MSDDIIIGEEEPEQKHLNVDLEALASIVSNTLVKDHKYYHCCGHGVIYAHKNQVTGDYEHPVMDYYKLTGAVSGLPSPFNDYMVTSGFCKPCLDKFKRDI